MNAYELSSTFHNWHVIQKASLWVFVAVGLTLSFLTERYQDGWRQRQGVI